MNKKAVAPAQWFILAVMIFSLAGIVFLIIYKNFGAQILALTPGIQIPGKTTDVQAEKLTQEINKTYEILKQLFQDSVNSKEQCIVAYDVLPNFKDYTVNIDTTADGVQLYIKNKQGQYINIAPINGIKPCIVAQGNAASNFINNHRYVNGNPPKKLEPESSDVSSIYFSEGTSFIADGISYSISDTGLNIGQKQVHLMYKSDKNHLCFFTTYFGLGRRFISVLGASSCGYSPSGLSANCIKEILPGGELNQNDAGGKPIIPFCSGEDPLCNIYKTCEQITDLDLCTKNICGLSCRVRETTFAVGRYCESYA